jgi:uncharacterized protein (TIGR02001 family)
MKNIIRSFVPILALAASAGAFGQTTAPAPAPAPAPAADSGTWVFTPTYVSTYMFRGVRLGGPSFEPSLEYDKGAGAIGLWTNFPLKDKVVGVSDPEIDLYGSYTLDGIKDTLSYTPGFTLYNYPNAKPANGFYKRTFEPSFAVNYTVGSFKLVPKVYYDFVLQGFTYELNASYALVLAEGIEIDFAGTYGKYQWNASTPDVTPDIVNRGKYWLAGISVPYAVTKTSKVTVGLALTEGTDNTYEVDGTGTGRTDNTAALRKTVFSLSYAISY